MEKAKNLKKKKNRIIIKLKLLEEKVYNNDFYIIV